MSTPEHDRRIDYVEFAAADLNKIKAFYRDAFKWEFQDYGPEYTSFNDGRLTGGFYKGPAGGANPLVVIYATELEKTEEKIKSAGGAIVKETFEFPGGRRFHFTDPCGNELAVWSDR
jgi:predicted enzyme related to lactoylglutathione lyase